ncbi:MAG: tetratricopeptide repeat protein [Acidobacteriota bacterium]|nr:tetratricopeptide repeat protein [Acidobacteriota bacterium]
MPSARTKLPIALTPLLGRAREIEETTRLLGATRLLTITGAGGSGKTRLALDLAHRMRDQFEDVVWVDLAPLSDPDLIGQQIIDAMGVRELAAEDVLRLVIDAVRDRSMLFVLDNCEHLVHASAVVTEEILRSCASTSIITTTREALGVRGEQTWLVPPLSAEDAAQLFIERARLVAPSFTADETLLRQICTRLDGIPLAIELAAARVKILSLAEIAARLDDAFRLLSSGSRTLPRHRTIRETIDWSYRLLSSDEQILLRRLAVFGASFSLDAAEAVCGGGQSAVGRRPSAVAEPRASSTADRRPPTADYVDVLTHLSALVDKSLVLAEQSRYRLLDTVRQFAAEKLDEAEERDSLAGRHAAYFLALVEELEPRLFAGADDPAALAIIDRDIDNIRAVFDRGKGGDTELRLLYALHWYWFARGHFHEARRRITAALARANDADPIVLAKAKVAAATAAVWQGDWPALRPMIDEAVEVLRDGPDTRALANALNLLGTGQAFADGDHGAAIRSFLEARRNAEGVSLALTLYWTGLAAQLRDDLESARAAFEEAHQIGVRFGNKPATAHPLTALGHIALLEGKRDEATRCFREALNIHAAIDDRWGLTHVVEGIGLILLEAREAETGTRLIAAASAAWLQLGARPGRDSGFEEEKAARIREALSDDRLRIVLASGAAMSYDSMVELAREQVHRLDTAESAPVRAPLSVRALGPLAIDRDGQTVEESARSRELLLYLLCHPSGRTKEQIGAALWPDADPAKLRNNFHVTLHRLRKGLGASEWIVVDGDTYALDRSRGVEFDAETFERETNAAIANRDKNARNLERLARAIDLYRGDFFENARDSEWHFPTRTRLRDLYARALDTLARAHTTTGNHPAAAETYQRLVNLDELDEDATRNLIAALEKQGDSAGAKRAYRRLTAALKRELGEEPSF